MKPEDEARIAGWMDKGRVDIPEVRTELDKLTTDQVLASLPDGEYGITYAVSPGAWKPGDGRPAFADEDPAVMCAIGRCAAARVRWNDRPESIGVDHHSVCGWCEMPLDELLKALDWFTWWSKQIVTERWSWKSNGVSYLRARGGGQYENPRVAAFVAFPPSEQSIRVQRVLAASLDRAA